MKIFTKTTGAVFVALTVLCSTAFADPLSDQLQSQKNKLNGDKAALQTVQDKLNGIEQNIEMLDEQIGSTLDEINKNKKTIENTKKEILSTENEIKISEENLKKSTDLLDKRVRAIYTSGTGSYIELILSSSSMGDLISKIQFITKIVSYDRKIIAEIKSKQDEITKRKETLTKQEEELTVLNKENEEKLLKLNENRKAQKTLIEDGKKQEKYLSLNVSTSQAQVNATLEQIAAIRKDAPKINLSRGAAPVSSNTVIAYATNFLGTPYVWGGGSPNPGFDCSGFTQYVYAHFGINLGRTTYDQINDGVQVSRDQLQPGDLVFFGSWSNPHHMGIYLGNNTYIHAPHTGDVVKVSTMNRNDYVTARRVK